MNKNWGGKSPSKIKTLIEKVDGFLGPFEPGLHISQIQSQHQRYKQGHACSTVHTACHSNQKDSAEQEKRIGKQVKGVSPSSVREETD